MRYLHSNSRWFEGPDFIYSDSVTKMEYVNPDLRENSNANVNLNKIDNEVLISTSAKAIINWKYYSSLTKLIRPLEWILKLKRNWIHWRRGKEDRVLTKLIATELQSSKKTLINLWQMKSYPLEYAALYSSK